MGKSLAGRVLNFSWGYLLRSMSETKLTHLGPLFKEKQLPLCHGQVRVPRRVEQKMASFKSCK